MRVFCAVNFDAETVVRFRSVQEKLRSFAESGNFIPAENLHLTLAFLGEVDYSRILRAETAIDAAVSARKAFKVRFVKTGCYKRGGYQSRSGDDGDLWWIGLEFPKSADGTPSGLSALHKSLVTNLWESGFPLENRPYEPHITLARRMIPAKMFPGECFACGHFPFTAEVRRVSLMKSERTRGKQIYTEIYGKDLGAVNE